MKNIFKGIGLVAVLVFSQNVLAEQFWKTGKIVATWSDQTYYSGCLIVLDNPIGNGCPANGYFTLDCEGKLYNKPENSKRLFSEALAAMHADKKISVLIDNTKKVNGYCAARVLRVYK